MQLPPLSLYVHIPWCVRKCPYCDFNSHAAGPEIPEQAYVQALLADLDQDLPLAAGRRIETVFFGGGTPSLFSAEAIAQIIAGIKSKLALNPEAEITLEANPGTAEAGKFKGFREAGVNRLSIGIQSFNDRHLQALGRIHGSAEAIAAAEMAVLAGLTNFNLDLMFGLPHQSQAEALADVAQAIALKPTHLSFYQLTLEPNTLFHKIPPPLPEDEVIWDIQQSCQQLMASEGYAQYEVSAYSQQGKRCQHNLNYWAFGDYLGIGAGAHGKVTDASGRILRLWKTRHPVRYLEAAGRPDCIGGQQMLAKTDLPVEFLMNQLRLRQGFTIAEFESRTGLCLGALEPELTQCLADGLLEQIGSTIRCTEQGWNFLDSVIQNFIRL